MFKLAGKISVILFINVVLSICMLRSVSAEGIASLTSWTVFAGDSRYDVPGSTTSYTMSVPYSRDEIFIQAEAADGIAITINDVAVDRGVKYGPIQLQPDSTTIMVKASDLSGNITEYTLQIDKLPAGHDARLHALYSPDVSISPVFDPDVFEYSLQSQYVEFIEIMASRYDYNATVRINGAIAQPPHMTQRVPLSRDDTEIVIEVIAEDGVNSRTYTIALTWLPMPPSTNNNLSSLVASTGTLTKLPNVNDTEYKLELVESKKFTITATAADDTASIKINGAPTESGQPSGALELVDNKLTVMIEVTAENGSIRVYTINAYYSTFILQNIGSDNITGGELSDHYMLVDGRTPYVAFNDGKDQLWKLSVMQWDGSQWVFLDKRGISTGCASKITLWMLDGELYVAFVDDVDRNPNTAGRSTIMKYEAPNWVTVGSPIQGGGFARVLTMAKHEGKVYFAQTVYTDDNTTAAGVIETYVLQDGAWSPFGGDAFEPGFGNALTEAGDELYYAYSTVVTEETVLTYQVHILRLEDNQWQEVCDAPQGFILNSYVVAQGRIYFSVTNQARAASSFLRYQSGSWQELRYPVSFGHNIFLYLVDGVPHIKYNADVKLGLAKLVGDSWSNIDIPSINIPFGMIKYQFSSDILYLANINNDDKLGVYKLQKTDDNSLTGLLLANGEPDLSYSKSIPIAEGDNEYSVTVPRWMDSLKLLATATDRYAAVSVNGIGVTRGQWVTFPVAPGDTHVTVDVYSSDGTSHTEYRLRVTRPADATLESLAVSSLTLRKAFHPDTLDYHAYAVDYRIDSVMVAAQLSDSAASFTVNGGAAVNAQPCEVPLQTGENTIRLEVRSADGTATLVYTIMVKRAPGSWQSVGTTARIQQTVMGSGFSVFGDSLYFVYRDSLGTLHIQRNKAGEWQSIDPDKSLYRSATDFSLIEFDGVPTVAFTDDDDGLPNTPSKLRVLKYSGGIWSLTGGASIGTSRDAYVSTATQDGVLYVSYVSREDSNRNLIVKAYNGSTWQTVGEAVTEYSLGSDLAVINGMLYVAYVKTSGSSYSPTENYSISVKRLDNGHWVSVGEPVITAKGRSVISLFSYQGSPCLDYTELLYFNSLDDYAVDRHITVYSGGSWEDLYGTVALPGGGLTGNFISWDGGLYYTHHEVTDSSMLEVLLLNDGQWVEYGSALLANEGDMTGYGLTFINGVPYTLIFHADKTVEAKKYQLPDTASLAALEPASGTLSPSFSPGISEYTLTVGSAVTSIRFTIRPEDRYASITVNGEPLANEAQCTVSNLAYGNNDVSVEVVSADSSIRKSFIIHVNREFASFTVRFIVYGNYVMNQIVNYNTTVVKPSPDPSLTGYSFSGWYKDSTCSAGNQWDFVNDVITTNITLYAKWTTNTYTISFDSQEGSPCEDIMVSYEHDYGTLPTPNRTGFSFAGWYTQPSGGILVTSTTTVTTASDHTLYAKWTINTHTVTFNPQGGTAVAPKTAQYNATITAPTPPTRAGYVFQGWYKEASCTNAWIFSTEKVTADITLYAKWVSTMPASVKAASASYTSIKVTWNAVPGAAGYQVYYATSSAGPWTLKGAVTAPAYSSTGLVTGKYYYFKVRSYNAAKVYSAFSAVVSTRPIPAAPYSVKAAASSYNSAKVSWGAVSGATRYEVYRATSSSGSYALVGTATSASYINTGLRTGSPYYYKVRCYHLESNVKIYGAFSAVVSVKTVIGAPGSVNAARASSTSIKVTWGAIGGATKYELWRSTSSAGTYTLVAATSSLYYTNTKLTTGRVYYYMVRAYRLEGSTKVYGPWSAVVYAKP